MNHSKRNPNYKSKYVPRGQTRNNDNPTREVKIVRKRYNVTTQTAYHIQELAFQEGTTEGRIIDKLMRSYLCDRASRYHPR